jgi:hypothetical protein
VIAGQRFIAGTTWFHPDSAAEQSKRLLHDFSLIKDFEPWVYEQNAAFEQVIAGRLKATDIVLTHHPSPHQPCPPCPVNLFSADERCPGCGGVAEAKVALHRFAIPPGASIEFWRTTPDRSRRRLHPPYAGWPRRCLRTAKTAPSKRPKEPPALPGGSPLGPDESDPSPVAQASIVAFSPRDSRRFFCGTCADQPRQQSTPPARRDSVDPQPWSWPNGIWVCCGQTPSRQRPNCPQSRPQQTGSEHHPRSKQP